MYFNTEIFLNMTYLFIKTHYKRFFLLLILMNITLMASARLGGSGGDGFSDSGGGDGGDLEAIIFIIEIILYIFLLPFPYNVIFFGLLILLVFYAARKRKQSSVLNAIQKNENGVQKESVIDRQLNQFIAFDKTSFLSKVEFAFKELQNAWCKKNISPVRRYISDGVYQRLNVQIMMMNELTQTNYIDHLNILEVKLANAYTESGYDILDVKISATIKDRFVSEKFSTLNQSFNETFSEFWTFIRKHDAKGGDLYFSQQCPSCKENLPADLGEVSVCPACGTFSNLGEYDWILSEITLASDYAMATAQSGIKNKLISRLSKLGDQTSVPQVIEDKASNAFLQIRIAEAMQDEKRVRRFCDDEFYSKLNFSSAEKFVFNRLYLSSVSMVNFYINEDFYYSVVQLNSHEQRVKVSGNKIESNTGLMAYENYLILKRSKNNEFGKGSVFSHRCSNCSGTIEDSLDLECSYCGSILNNPEKDWIVTDLLTKSEYNSRKYAYGEAIIPKRKEEKLEGHGLTARDYAINNIVVLLACDGDLNDQEKEYAKQTAGSMGYNKKKIAALWENNQVSHMAIMVPEDPKMKRKTLQLMHKAAAADGQVSEREQEFLNEIEKRFAEN